jgi:hypothetical protein
MYLRPEYKPISANRDGLLQQNTGGQMNHLKLYAAIIAAILIYAAGFATSHFLRKPITAPAKSTSGEISNILFTQTPAVVLESSTVKTLWKTKTVIKQVPIQTVINNENGMPCPDALADCQHALESVKCLPPTFARVSHSLTDIFAGVSLDSTGQLAYTGQVGYAPYTINFSRGRWKIVEAKAQVNVLPIGKVSGAALVGSEIEFGK